MPPLMASNNLASFLILMSYNIRTEKHILDIVTTLIISTSLPTTF